MMSITDKSDQEALKGLTFGDKVEMSYGRCTETFVCSHYGTSKLFISIEFGYAYTRPQLIAKYSNVGATFRIRAIQH